MAEILIFNDTMQYGGSEILLVDILNYLSKKEDNITLLLPFPTNEDILLSKVSPRVSVRYIYEQRPSRKKKIFYENLMSFAPKLHNKLVGLDLNEYDTLISFKDSVFSIIFSKEKQRKILWIHNLPTRHEYDIENVTEYIPVKLLKIRINRLIRSYRKFNDIVCVSQICLDRYTKVFNRGAVYIKQQLHIIHNAINSERIKKLADEPCDYPMDEHPTFIMATRFSHEKRIDRVVKACKKLVEKGFKFKVLIIGDGYLKETIESKITERKLGSVIELLGYKDNPYPYIKKADWLISSSEKESFSLVLLESIYLGTPVITTDCGGPSEITDKGKYGLLTPNNTRGFYEGMKTILENPTLAKNYTSKSEECLSRFDYNKWLERIDELIHSC